MRSKFAKEVGKRFVDHRRARRRRILQDALQKLQYHARMYKEQKVIHAGYLLKRKTLVGLLKKNNETSVKAARNSRDSERMQCKTHWDTLEAHGELPIDPATGRRWKNFDEFIDCVTVTEKVYA